MTTAPAWRKSSRSNTQGGDCVEVADLGGSIGIRDSKDPDGPRLIVRPAVFAALVRQVKSHQLDG